MKRKVYVATGLLALSLAIVVAAQLNAQGTNNATPPRTASTTTAPATKVAIVNLNIISKKYDKVKTFNEETKKAAEPFVNIDKTLKKEHDDLMAKAQQPTTSQVERDGIERKVKEIQRKAEDNKMEAQKVVGKKNEEQLKILFMDLHKVVTQMAQARGYELVMHYNDITDSADYWGAPNIARKMQTGALMPIYWVGGIDISNDVVNTLNDMAKRR